VSLGTLYTARDWASLTSGATAAGLTAVTQMTFGQTATIKRPTLSTAGDVVVPASGTSTPAAIFARRRKAVLSSASAGGGGGEVYMVTAAAYFPLGTDVMRRDRVSLASGQAGGPAEFEVVTVMPGLDCYGVVDHMAVELRNAPEGDR
jgi:hypothetical protein